MLHITTYTLVTLYVLMININMHQVAELKAILKWRKQIKQLQRYTFLKVMWFFFFFLFAANNYFMYISSYVCKNSFLYFDFHQIRTYINSAVYSLKKFEDVAGQLFFDTAINHLSFSSKEFCFDTFRDWNKINDINKTSNCNLWQ